jgi:hypothetical protein
LQRRRLINQLQLLSEFSELKAQCRVLGLRAVNDRFRRVDLTGPDKSGMTHFHPQATFDAHSWLISRRRCKQCFHTVCLNFATQGL